jgi:hypothetical protein
MLHPRNLAAIPRNAEIFEGRINHVRWFSSLPREKQTAILAIAEVENMELVHRIKETLLFEVEAQRCGKELKSDSSQAQKGDVG